MILNPQGPESAAPSPLGPKRSLSVQLRCEVRPPSGPSSRWVRLPQGRRSFSRGLKRQGVSRTAKTKMACGKSGTIWLSVTIIYGFIRFYKLYYQKKTSLGGASGCWFLSKKNLDRTSNENCWSKTGEFKDINETTPTSCKNWVMEIKSKAMGQSKTEMLWTSKRCRQQKKRGWLNNLTRDGRKLATGADYIMMILLLSLLRLLLLL